MSAPLFSIITPSFNCAAKLKKTLESVLSQAPGLFEMIVVDGASTDGTVDVLREYGGQVRWISEPDSGLYDAMNKGIAMARGTYLNFQGAGDTLRPGILGELSPGMPTEPLWFLYGKVYLCDAKHEHGEPFTRMTLRNGNIPHQSVFYERSIFDLIGAYPTEYRTGADYVMAMRCFGEERVRKMYVDRVIADFEGGGISATNPETKLERDLPMLIRTNLGLKPYLTWRLQRLVPLQWREARVNARRARESR